MSRSLDPVLGRYVLDFHPRLSGEEEGRKRKGRPGMWLRRRGLGVEHTGVKLRVRQEFYSPFSSGPKVITESV